MVQYIVDFLNSLQGLRKTIVMFMVIVISMVFRIKGLITSDNMESLLRYTVIAYFGSNSVEHYSSMIKAQLDAKTGKTVEAAEIETNTVEEK